MNETVLGKEMCGVEVGESVEREGEGVGWCGEGVAEAERLTLPTPLHERQETDFLLPRLHVCACTYEYVCI